MADSTDNTFEEKAGEAWEDFTGDWGTFEDDFGSSWGKTIESRDAIVASFTDWPEGGSYLAGVEGPNPDILIESDTSQLFTAEHWNDVVEAQKKVNNVGVVSGSLKDATLNAVEVGDAAVAFAENYVNKKWLEIKEMLLTPTEISVGALMQDIAPKALSLTDTAKKSEQSLKPLLRALGQPTTWLDWGYEVLGDLASDPGVAQALGDTMLMQTVANTLEEVSDTMTVIENVVTALDPIMPLIEITVDFALAWTTAGVSGVDATNKQSELLEKYMLDLTLLWTETIRKVFYDIKIKVPTIVLKLLNGTLDALGAADDYEWSDLDWRAGMIFEESYSQGLKSSRTWTNYAKQNIRNVKNIADKTLEGDLTWLQQYNVGADNPLFTTEGTLTSLLLGNAAQEAQQQLAISEIVDEFVQSALSNDKDNLIYKQIAGTDGEISIEEAENSIKDLLTNNGIQLEDISLRTLENLSRALVSN